MGKYKFSPIKNQDQLMAAIRYTHFKCFELCQKVYGRYLPVAGNIGIFCHDEEEYEMLTKLRLELTKETDHWNNKYFRLYEPIVIGGSGDVPDTIYTYLYIRRPDQHQEVGDVDFVLDQIEYEKLKASLRQGQGIPGLSIFDRPDLDLVRLLDPDFDVLAFIGSNTMAQNINLS